jgi:plasmid stabilization system protein ParE
VVIWTIPAQMDLKEIHDFIAKDSLLYAQKVTDEIVETSDSLTSLPRRGRIVPEIESENIREIFLYSYRMIYEITDHSIYILALLHAKRNLSPEEIIR